MRVSCHQHDSRQSSTESLTQGMGPRQGGQVAVLRTVKVVKKAPNRKSYCVSHSKGALTVHASE